MEGSVLCAMCGASDADKRCSRCKAVVYCGAECQRRHWTKGGHKQECKPAAADDTRKAATPANDRDGGVTEAAATPQKAARPPQAPVAAPLDPETEAAAEVRNAAGTAAYQARRFADAADEFVAAAALVPAEPKYHGNHARALLDLQDFAGAEAAAREALRLLTAPGTALTAFQCTQRVKWTFRLASALEGLKRHEAALTVVTEASVFAAAMEEGRELWGQMVELRKLCETRLIPPLEPVDVERTGASSTSDDALDEDDRRTAEGLSRLVKAYPEAVAALWRKVKKAGEQALANQPEQHPLRLAWKGVTSLSLAAQYADNLHIRNGRTRVPGCEAAAALALEQIAMPLTEVVMMCISCGASKLYVPASANREGVMLCDRVSDATAVQVARYGLHTYVIPKMRQVMRVPASAEFLKRSIVNMDRRLREVMSFVLSGAAFVGADGHPEALIRQQTGRGGWQHLAAPYATLGSLMWRCYHGARCNVQEYPLAYIEAEDMPEAPIHFIDSYPLTCLTGFYANLRCVPHIDVEATFEAASITPVNVGVLAEGVYPMIQDAGSMLVKHVCCAVVPRELQSAWQKTALPEE